MANWYVSASGNDTTGAGTQAAPYATMSKIVALGTLAPGDVIRLAGIIRDDVTFTSPHNLTIRQWQGQTKYDIRGAFVASGFAASGGGYTKTLATGLTIKSVVCDWDTSIEENGLHYGHLTLAADAATALATLNNWFYNSGTGVLSINIGADPASHVIEYCIGGVGVTGIGFSDADGLSILDFRASLWADPTTASGQAIRGHGQNILIEVDRVDDCGYHHICIADGLCTNVVIRPSATGKGIIAGAAGTGCIPLVFHTSTAGQVNAEAQDLIVYETPILNRSGNPMSASWAIGGCFSHTANGVKFDGITWRNIKVRCPHTIGVSSTPFGAADTTPPGAVAVAGPWSSAGTGRYNATVAGSLTINGVCLNGTWLTAGTFGSLSAGQWGYSGTTLQVRNSGSTDPTGSVCHYAMCADSATLTLANYGVKFIECEVSGDHAQGMVMNDSCLYQRCSLKFGLDRFTAGSNGWWTDAGNGGVKTVAFDASEVLMYQGTGAASATEGFRPGTFGGFVFLNTAVAMWGVRTAECRVFIVFAATQNIYARQSIFGFPDASAGTRRLFNNDGSIAQVGAGPSYPRNFDDCGYIRITGFGYSNHASYDTPAEWLSTVDTHAQQFVTNNVWEEPFSAQPMSHARLSRATGRLWTYRSTGTPHTDLGINWKPWTGALGPYQYGAGPAYGPLN